MRLGLLLSAISFSQAHVMYRVKFPQMPAVINGSEHDDLLTQDHPTLKIARSLQLCYG